MNLERNIPITEIKVGDIIAPEERYITSAGYYFQVGKRLDVIRVNLKSITVKCEFGNVRISKKAALVKYNGGYVETIPKFARVKEIKKRESEE